MNTKLSESAKILFISDAHMGGFSAEKNTRIEMDLIRLLEFADKHSYKIAILGDLFDYWMEYPQYIPKIGKNLLQHFSDFNQSNPTIYITGNHDNWTRGHFTKLGFHVEHDYRILKIDGRKILLLHGDAIGEKPENLKRPILHRIMRNKLFVKVYQTLLPPKKGLRLMKNYSRFTNFLSSRKEDPTPLNKWAENMLRHSEADVIICGHDHIPRIHKYDFGTYINLGTFHHHKTLAAYNNNRFRLVRWNSARETITPFLPSEINE